MDTGKRQRRYYYYNTYIIVRYLLTIVTPSLLMCVEILSAQTTLSLFWAQKKPRYFIHTICEYFHQIFVRNLTIRKLSICYCFIQFFIYIVLYSVNWPNFILTIGFSVTACNAFIRLVIWFIPLKSQLQYDAIQKHATCLILY